MVAFIVVWGLAAGAYGLFTGSFSAEEVITAAICGLVISLWSAAIRRHADQRFAYARGTLAASARGFAGLPMATLRVGRRLSSALARPTEGKIARQAFEHGRRRAPDDAARRAVATLAVSLAPDRFVLRLPEGDDEMIVHALVPAGGAADARWGQ
jgi:hypothetical protein